MRKGLALAAALLALACLAAPAGAAISPVADAPTWTVGKGVVDSIAPDGDRAWVGGGFFNTAPRTGPGAELDRSGNVVGGFPELTDSSGPLAVSAVTSDGAGGWYVAGSFTRAGGIARPGLVHVFGNGAVDTGFDAQVAAGTVHALTLAGGGLYVGGTFGSIGGATRSSLAELDPATGTATGWDPSTTVTAGTADVRAIAIQNGFAWVGGGFDHVGTTAVTNAAKVPLGSSAVNADTGWVPNPNTQVDAILTTASDVYVGGTFTQIDGVATNKYVAKVAQASGSALDAAWAPNPSLWVTSLATDGTNVYAAGLFSSFGGQGRGGVAATGLTGTGAALAWNPALTTGGKGASIAIAGGTVYIGGSFTKSFGDQRSGLAAAPVAAADPNGALTSWAPEATDDVNAVAADGTHVYAGGQFSGLGAKTQESLMAVDLTTGQAMPYFNHSFDGPVYQVAVCSGIVYAVGQFFTVDGQTRLNAAAFDRNTGALTNWNPDLDNDGDAVACGSGVVYIGGIFDFVQDSTTPITRHGIAAVDPASGLPTAWDPANGLALSAGVRAIAVRGSTVYAGGSFANLGGQARNNIAAIDASTGLAGAWNPNADAGVDSIVLTASTAYIGGTFKHVGGLARGLGAQVDLATGAPTAFDAQGGSATVPSPNISALALGSDGSVYASGDFDSAGGLARNGVAALDPASGNALSWNPNPQGPSPVSAYTVAATPDGRVLVGGGFSGMTGAGLYGLATFSEPTSFATRPALTSAPVEGQPTSCDGGTPGGSLPARQTVQWQLDGTPIAGATASGYTPTTSDVGHALSCHVSQRNLISSAQADSASMSVAAAPVQAQTPAPAPFDIDGFATPPPPVAGKSVIAAPTKGTVTVLLPTFRQFIPLPDAERIPVGTVVDARHGTVELTTVGKGGKLQSALFYEGEFQIFQDKGKNPVVELRLYGGNFSVCRQAKRAGAALAAGTIPKSRSIRHLWGSGKGLFRTKGRYATATIRGTKWLTDDRCDGTLVRVAKGAVTVRDIPKKKTLALGAPKSYLALAHR